MKTLYVSDLDGTLLNEKKELSETTIRLLNQFINQGGLFSVATARFPYTCDYRLEEVKWNIPVILMNGALLYDLKEGKCMDCRYIGKDTWKTAVRVLKEYGCDCYVYSYYKEKICLYFENPELDSEGQYYNERARNSCLYAGRTESVDEISGEVIYMAVVGDAQAVKRAEQKLKSLTGISSSGYKNVYTGGYCLELYSEQASKAGRALELKQLTGADRLVSFGDNYNDMEMMRVSDAAYAPENALEEAKELANRILASNREDGVARFLAEEMNR